MTGRPDDPEILASLVEGLRPAEPGHHDGTSSGPAGAGVRAWAAEVAATVTSMTADADDDIADLPLAQMRQATEDSLLRIVRELCGGGTDVRLTEAQNEIVRYSAARDIPFERMVGALRRVQARWTDVLLGEVGRLGHWQVAPAVVMAVARQVDAVVDASIRAYLRERERLLTGAEARRRELVDALLAGHPVDPLECRTHLGVELDHQHLAMILRDVSGQHGAATGLVPTAKRAARAVGAATSFVHQPSPATVWLWASHPRTMSIDGLTALEGAVRASGQRLAAGNLRAGAAGVRRSHDDAVAAERMPMPHDGGPPVVLYRDVDLCALLAADLDQARRSVRDHLGALAGSGPDTGELRETLTRYYRANMSLLAAAAPLHVHRNTVVYRLRRIEQILGHPVTEGAPELRCALLLAERFGSHVLADDDT